MLRDHTHKRGYMPSCGVRPSVRSSVLLSVEFVYCQNNVINHVLKLFSPSDSHAILVFPYQTLWQYSDGNPANRGVECRWSRQKWRFSARRPIYIQLCSPNGSDIKTISGCRNHDCWSANSNCDGPPCNLPHRPSRISESCLLQPAAWTTMRKREENRI